MATISFESDAHGKILMPGTPAFGSIHERRACVQARRPANGFAHFPEKNERGPGVSNKAAQALQHVWRGTQEQQPGAAAVGLVGFRQGQLMGLHVGGGAENGVPVATETATIRSQTSNATVTKWTDDGPSDIPRGLLSIAGRRRTRGSGVWRATTSTRVRRQFLRNMATAKTTQSRRMRGFIAPKYLRPLESIIRKWHWFDRIRGMDRPGMACATAVVNPWRAVPAKG